MTMRRFFECTAGQYMSPKPRSVAPGLALRDLEQLFEALDYNAFPVVENDKLVGFVTKFDFLKAFIFTTQQMVPHYDELMAKTVSEVMSTGVVNVEDTTPLTRALQLMVETKARSFPVVDHSGKVVGMLSRSNIARALKESTTEA
jgi:CBS domain-containing protein